MITETTITSQAKETGKIGLLLWISFSICFLCNMSAGLISTLMSVYLPPVVAELTGRDTGEMERTSAYIQALYVGGWAIGGFFSGYISDRIGRVKALALSVGVFGLSTLLISFATSWEYVVACRLLSGLAVG